MHPDQNGTQKTANEKETAPLVSSLQLVYSSASTFSSLIQMHDYPNLIKLLLIRLNLTFVSQTSLGSEESEDVLRRSGNITGKGA